MKHSVRKLVLLNSGGFSELQWYLLQRHVIIGNTQKLVSYNNNTSYIDTLPTCQYRRQGVVSVDGVWVGGVSVGCTSYAGMSGWET